MNRTSPGEAGTCGCSVRVPSCVVRHNDLVETQRGEYDGGGVMSNFVVLLCGCVSVSEAENPLCADCVMLCAYIFVHVLNWCWFSCRKWIHVQLCVFRGDAIYNFTCVRLLWQPSLQLSVCLCVCVCVCVCVCAAGHCALLLTVCDL